MFLCSSVKRISAEQILWNSVLSVCNFLHKSIALRALCAFAWENISHKTHRILASGMSHADVADFHRQCFNLANYQRSKFCEIPCFLCATFWHKNGRIYFLLTQRRKVSQSSAWFCVVCVQLFHTELKVAVRTCEGKAIHGRTQRASSK